MAKNILSLFLSILLIFGVIASGLSKEDWKALLTPSAEDDLTGPATDLLGDDKKFSVLIIGNSHSIDAFQLLYTAFKDQYPDREFFMGVLHHNGASLSEHASFAAKNKAVCRYHKNYDNRWEIETQKTPKEVLTDQPWDVVMIQPAKEDLSDSTLSLGSRLQLEHYIDLWVTHPHRILWHISWPSPNDETFFSPDYVRQPPKNYKNNLKKLYGFDPVNQYQVMLDATKKHILSDQRYDKAVCSGAAVMHAYLTQGRTQLDLWRDYTHLNDFGRLIVGYSLVAQLTNKPIEQINLNSIPPRLRHHMYRELGAFTITEEMKDVAIKAANYSINNAWVMPKTAE